MRPRYPRLILGSLVAVQICTILTHNILIMITMTACLYLGGITYFSKRETLARARIFTIVGIALVIFQLVSNILISPSERIMAGILTALKLATLSQSVYLAILLISPSEVVVMLSPLPNTWRLLVTMTFSSIPILVREYRSIVIAARARAAGSSVRGRLLGPFALMIPLIHRVFVRSNSLALSLTCRGVT